MIKTFKIFLENSSNHLEKLVQKLTNAKLGTIVDEADVYVYVEYLHSQDDPYFDMQEDGNIGQRIEVYKKFQLKEISIDSIDTDRFMLDQDKLQHYTNFYKNTKKYPPIVLGHQFLIDDDFNIQLDENDKPIIIGEDYEIIDGSHRINALLSNNVYKVKAWVGLLD